MKCKKIFSGLIAGVMAFSCVIAGSDGFIENFFDSSFTAEAGYGNVSGYENFDMDCYVAGLMTDTDNPIYKTIDSTLTLDTPSRVLVNSIESDVGFMSSMAAWEVLTFQPSDTTEVVINEIAYYETVILKTLKTSVETDYVKKLLDEETAQNTQRLFSIYKNTMKLEYMIDGLDNVDFTKISPEKQSNLIDGFQKSFKTAFPKITTASTFVDYFSIFVKEGKAIEESINNLCAYMACADMSEYMKQVVSDLYANCDGILYPTMKQALLNVKTACGGYEMAFNAAVFDFSIKSFSIVYGEVVDSMFSSIIGSTALGCGILIGQAIGKNISDILFSTDATCEQYYKMRALCEFEDVLRTVTRIEMNRFKSVPSKDNANVMFSAVDMLYTEYDISCDLAIEYSDIVFTKNLASYFCNNSDKYNKFVTGVENMRQMSNQSYEVIIKDGYIYYLEGDYPDIYEALIAQNEEAEKKANIIEVKSISFPVDSVEWGTEDTMLKYDSATISPSNSTNSQIIYTSSDESVVSYHIWGAEVHNPGTAVITATSVSSGLTATLNVTVVEGQGKDGIYIEPTDEPSPKLEIDDEFIINNITYKIKSIYSKQVKVLNAQPNINGVIIVPSKVSYKNELFNVTEIAEGKIYGTGAAKGVFTNGGSYGYRNTTVKEIILPNSINYIGRFAFCYCANLKYIEIPEGVTGLGMSLFDFSGVTTVVIPKSLKSLSGCGATGSTFDNGGFPIKEVYYRGSEKEWDNLSDATGDYTGLKSVKVYFMSISKCEKGDEFIVDNLIYCVSTDNEVSVVNCDTTAIGTINIPNYIFYSGYEYNVTSIGIGAFSDCTRLTNITIPDSVITIGIGAFTNCTKLTSITIPDRVTSIEDDTFYDCDHLTNIIISDSVINIGHRAFEDCDNLTSIIIPDGVISIGSSAFFWCNSLASIEIPNSVTEIYDNAFKNCISLESVTIINPDCEIYDDENTISETATIYGYTNSTAQAYAKKYNRKFISLGEVPETQQGDANGDGIISISDVVLIQKALVNSNIDTKPAMAVVDMNQDGKFNVFDLIIVRRMVLNT